MAVKKSDIVAKLTEIGATFEEGAKVDELRALFTDEEMAALEAEVKAREAEAQANTIRCIVLRDYWDAAENRVRAGEVVSLPVDIAMDGVESGSLARAK